MKYFIGSFIVYLIATGKLRTYMNFALVGKDDNITQADLFARDNQQFDPFYLRSTMQEMFGRQVLPGIDFGFAGGLKGLFGG